jgi:hypothetical protein
MLQQQRPNAPRPSLMRRKSADCNLLPSDTVQQLTTLVNGRRRRRRRSRSPPKLRQVVRHRLVEDADPGHDKKRINSKQLRHTARPPDGKLIHFPSREDLSLSLADVVVAVEGSVGGGGERKDKVGVGERAAVEEAGDYGGEGFGCVVDCVCVSLLGPSWRGTPGRSEAPLLLVG